MKRLSFALLCLLILGGQLLAQDALPISKTDRSILQARDEAVVQPGYYPQTDISWRIRRR